MRDGWLYGRGVSDDKGNYWALLRAALDLAESGELGVNVRVISDGEEEIGGHSVIDYLETLDDSSTAAVIFDGGMADAERPAITTALRGWRGSRYGWSPTSESCTPACSVAPRQTQCTTWSTLLAAVAGHDELFADGSRR